MRPSRARLNELRRRSSPPPGGGPAGALPTHPPHVEPLHVETLHTYSPHVDSPHVETAAANGHRAGAPVSRPLALRWLPGSAEIPAAPPQLQAVLIRLCIAALGLTVFSAVAGAPADAQLAGHRAVGALLFAAAVLVPHTAGVLAVIADSVFLITVPQLPSPYLAAVIISGVLLLASRRRVGFALAALSTAGAHIVTAAHNTVLTTHRAPAGDLAAGHALATAAGASGAGAVTFDVLGAWGAAGVIGLLAVGAEARLRAEVRRRKAACRSQQRQSRDHAGELARLRRALTLDTHDTLTHALAAEAAIIRVLRSSRRESADDRLLCELALVNGQAQRQLRRLLARFGAGAQAAGQMRLDRELQAGLNSISCGMRAGGYTVATATRLPVTSVPADYVEQAALLLHELAANIVKHATGTDCTLTVGIDPGIDPGSGLGRQLVLTSTNAITVLPPAPPRSLSVRAGALGGSCTIAGSPGAPACGPGRLTVTVRVPLPDHPPLRDDSVDPSPPRR